MGNERLIAGATADHETLQAHFSKVFGLVVGGRGGGYFFSDVSEVYVKFLTKFQEKMSNSIPNQEFDNNVKICIEFQT